MHKILQLGHFYTVAGAAPAKKRHYFSSALPVISRRYLAPRGVVFTPN